MSIIEKAVQRLDQLKRAGVDVPAVNVPPVNDASASAPVTVAPAAAVAPTVVPAPVAMTSPATKMPEPDAASVSRKIEIDLNRLNGLGMVTPLNARSTIAEEYRVVKRPLLRNVAGQGANAIKHANLIMVTSSVPGEGKSFSSINLAISMAMELDRTVLLVDADVSRPSVLNLLGLPPARGLMDVLLSDDIELSDVLLRTNVEKLTLLPAGMPYQRATELLASESMTNLLDQIATRYPDRIVIFDSPPLLVTTEARVLATHMGQVVVIVESGRTTQSMVKQALLNIETCPVKLMLLNKTRESGPGGYYGYYAPYGYGQQEK
ncbi:MAG TPA: XrtA-associated tyrosine autokinase [Rhodocyclaceae bacterium]|nr:XrtA-associated tyrosine autokinase [Rhodocyclaceae bacterium]